MGIGKVKYGIEKKNGELYAELLAISSIFDDNNNLLYRIGLFSNITKIKNYQQQLESIAYYDPLTKLPNRALFSDRFTHAISQSIRHKTSIAICFLDLDGFKAVNDHDVGDQVLINVAKRIKESVRDEDTISRHGGDEFIIMLYDFKSVSYVEKLLTRIILSINKPYLINGEIITISASIGATLSPADSSDLSTLIKNADKAMYQAKLEGKNRYKLYNTINTNHS